MLLVAERRRSRRPSSAIRAERASSGAIQHGSRVAIGHSELGERSI